MAIVVAKCLLFIVVHSDIQSFIDEQKAETFAAMARLDDYSLTQGFFCR